MPDAHIATQQHFIDCLESGQEFEISEEETIKTMAFVYACYQSAESNELIRPKELLDVV